MKPSSVYAFCGSERVGCFFIVIENDFRHEKLNCLTLPELTNDCIKLDEFTLLLENKFIEKVDDLPQNIFATCQKQYYNNREIIDNLITGPKNESTNRRKQCDVESPSRKQTIH